MGDALLGFLGVLVGALVSFLATERAERSRRAHDTATQVRTNKSATYVDMLTYLWTGKLAAHQVAPLMGNEPDPLPSGPTEAETTPMLARLDAFGSPKVRTMFQEYVRLLNRTFLEASFLREDRRDRDAGTLTEERGDYRNMMDFRKQLDETWGPLVETVRRELAHDAPTPAP